LWGRGPLVPPGYAYDHYTGRNNLVGRGTTEPNFHSPANFLQILEVCQRRLHMFCRPRKHTTAFCREKLWEVLRECGLDGRLLLAVKSLYTCWEVYVVSESSEWYHNRSSGC